MDEHQGETNGKTTEFAVSVTVVGNTEDDHQEHKGQQRFHKEGTPHGDLLITTSNVSSAEEIAITIGSESAEGHVSRLGNHHQQETGDDTTDDLGQPINKHLFECHATISPNTKTDCRVQVSTRDVTNAVSHGNNGKTESNGYAKETNMSEDCSTATTEDKYEGAEQFGEEFVTNLHN